jgi:hypothetical protein
MNIHTNRADLHEKHGPTGTLRPCMQIGGRRDDVSRQMGSAGYKSRFPGFGR